MGTTSAGVAQEASGQSVIRSAPAEPALRWLWELTSLPTAAGREARVVEWIRRWVAERADLSLRTDDAGNLVVERRDGAAAGNAPTTLFITAHLDHPAFVVERFVAPSTVLMSFRGGVMEPYFKDARVQVFPKSGAPVGGVILEKTKGEKFPECLIELDGPDTAAEEFEIGDVGRWELPEPTIEGDIFHTHACDDLAAVAAALAAMEELRGQAGAGHVKLLFTRAEEIGFVGAIAACRLKTMPADARVLALENSRSFPTDSPIGGGPIVRVGDRMSTFSPALTAAVAKVAERIAGEASRNPGETAPPGAAPAQYRWQRKLMAGGACEATAYQAYGYEATCVCLPLGNYHNMANLQAVQDGDAAAVAGARVGREYISLNDYRGMVKLLVGCGVSLSQGDSALERMEKLYAEKRFVLE
jgi:endoglucanase